MTVTFSSVSERDVYDLETQAEDVIAFRVLMLRGVRQTRVSVRASTRRRRRNRMRARPYIPKLSSIPEEPSFLEDRSVADSPVPLRTFAEQFQSGQVAKPPNRSIEASVTMHECAHLQPERSKKAPKRPVILLLIALSLFVAGVLLVAAANSEIFQPENVARGRDVSGPLVFAGGVAIVLAVLVCAVLLDEHFASVTPPIGTDAVPVTTALCERTVRLTLKTDKTPSRAAEERFI